MTKKLEKIRDEKFNTLRGADDFIWAPRNSYSRGFDAAVAELMPQIGKLVETLEIISMPNERPSDNSSEYQKSMYWSGHALDNENEATKALKEWREFIGEE